MTRTLGSISIEEFTKMATGVDHNRFDDPLFIDLLTVSYVDARFGIRPDRVLDPSYLNGLGFEKVSINSQETRKVMFTLGFNFSRLGEGGYIREQAIEADKKCLEMLNAGMDYAYAGFAVASVACTQFILSERPEFKADIVTLSNAIMYAAEQDNAAAR